MLNLIQFKFWQLIDKLRYVIGIMGLAGIWVIAKIFKVELPDGMDWDQIKNKIF